MDQINTTILKTTIEAIPVLNEENFSSWQKRITALFKLGGLKDSMINGKPALEDEDNSILCAIILAKISQETHSNIVNSENEDDTQGLWKAILKRFISSEPSNQARVYNTFANITFDVSNIEKFITEARSSIVKLKDVGVKLKDVGVKLKDVGVKLPEDIITYNLLSSLPASFGNIKQAITHSQNGDDIKPSMLFNHLEIHLNELKVSSTKNGSTGATIFTKEDTRCINGAHNPFAPHKKDCCWQLHPHLRAEHFKKNDEKNVSWTCQLQPHKEETWYSN
ncbi:hypothetical protein VP01_1144g7 [Puccinia sorghi]|uniref:Retrovirus-related Pol polyprotein from transposon TNT 1-94 n=1 Tax=Puccinia sorghi TaxID=27349 RepID=A0A0L6VS42_9BASI|nr:hypothetical protein VP01_1144g7 [Puccinia sorghi]